MTQTTPFESGSPSSRICLVGEAPSWEEIRLSRPFCGPSGQLLDLCLHSAGIARAACYVTNVFETMVKRPEARGKDGNKIVSLDGSQLLWTSTKGFTEAGLAASAGCLRRIASSTANVIVPLGGPALTLCSDSAVNTTSKPLSPSKWRGSIFYGNAAIDHRKLVPSLHPSSALRGVYEHRYLIISDLKKAKEESSSPEFVPTQRELIIDPSHAECIAFLRECLAADVVDTDLEILGGQIDCFSLSIDPSRAISIPLLDHNFESRWSVRDEREIWQLYAEIISSPRITKINQNILFDLTCLMQLNNIVPRGPLQDPMVAFSIMYPPLKHGLGTLCSMLTREPYYKDDGDLEDSPSVEDFERRWGYNAKDAAIALECWQNLAPVIDAEGYRATYDMTMRLVAPLSFMMVNGMKLDEPALLEARIRAKQQIAEKVAQLQAAIGRSVITEAPKKAAEKRAAAAVNAININSTKQMAEHFYHVRKVKPYVNHNGGETTDDLALARIFRRDDLIEAKLLQEYRALDKLDRSYLQVGYDPDRRLRCSYNIRGTMFGRLSASDTVFNTGMTLQTLPQEFRGFLVSDSYQSKG